MNRIRVLLVDDHHVVRAAVANFLSREPDIEVVGEVGEAEQLQQAVAELAPTVLLLDAHMPGQNVIQAAQALHERWPDLQILVLSGYARREYVVGLLRSGASGYVLKDDTPEMLIQAVRKVARGQEWLSPRVLKILMNSVRQPAQDSFRHLTDREVEILTLMAGGSKNLEIADQLVISEQTVKNHIRHIFDKLGVDSRVDAVLYAVQHGLAPDSNDPSLRGQVSR